METNVIIAFEASYMQALVWKLLKANETLPISIDLLAKVCFFKWIVAKRAR
jgi:hypothetical protein